MKVDKFIYGWGVVWNDNSKSYYSTKEDAISEMRREQGRKC